MDEVLEKFLKEQKMKLAEERASLEQDRPYMEIRRRTGRVQQKENIPPHECDQDGVSLPLGEEYERKKQKLQEELREDYRKFMEEKDNRDAVDIITVPERRRMTGNVRVRHVGTLTDLCGLGWGVCNSEDDCSDEELVLLQRRHQRERETRREVYTEMRHPTSKLQHRNRTLASVKTQANERSGSVASQDTAGTASLFFGAQNVDGTLQRRKDHYRRELQEQIAEQQSYKRREKELEVKVTRVTDSVQKQLFLSEAPVFMRDKETDRGESREDNRFLLDTADLPENLPSPSRSRRLLDVDDAARSALPTSSRRQVQTDRLRYKDELQKQIDERAAQKRLEKEEKRRLEAELEADMKTYEPWGRGGAGAPLRDPAGNLITDLKQMHFLNATAQRQEKPASTQTPQFGRGSASSNQSPNQHVEQDQYKAYLKQQMEEKQHKQAEERERLRAEEEKEERRLAEEREKLRREYEEERENMKRKEMQKKMKNEQVVLLAEKRQRDLERKRKEEEEKGRAAALKLEEQERRKWVQQTQREPSPPIPTLRNKHPSSAQDKGVPKFPVPPPTNDNLKRTDSKQQLSEERIAVVSQLCALRRRLRSEQRRLEEQIFHQESERLPSRSTSRHRIDVFDMARLRMPVRGPSHATDPLSLKRNDMLYSDAFLPPPSTWQSRNKEVEGGRGSALLSESEFIDLNGVPFPVPPDVDRKSATLSARERRRRTNLQIIPMETSGNLNAERHQRTINANKLRDTNMLDMKKLQAFDHHVTAGNWSDEEDDVGHDEERFHLRSSGRPASTDTWTRVESSETLRRLMSGSEAQ